MDNYPTVPIPSDPARTDMEARTFGLPARGPRILFLMGDPWAISWHKSHTAPCYDARTPSADGRFAVEAHSKDSSLMLSASHLAAHRRREFFAPILLVLGLFLVPVQCSLGLHSIFIASSSLVAATPAHETPHRHAAADTVAHASDASDGLRTSASEQRMPVPITPVIVDHPYTVALSRFVTGVDLLTASLPLVIRMTPAPDAVSVAPEIPPPREIA